VKKYKILVALAALLLFESACKNDITPAITPVTSDKPNVLLIIADDMGWDAFGKYPRAKGQKAKTPVLDSLAKAGITFNNLWVNPVYSPTRAAIFTGKYGFRTGVGTAIGGNTGGLSFSEPLLQKYINDKTGNQYATAVIGKWHLSNNTQLSAPEQFGEKCQDFKTIFDSNRVGKQNC
jgi:arylsulfatase B